MREYEILSKINSPEDVRELTERELTALASEIRDIIIETAAKNGGHLASNLGMVEVTLAMHRVFSCPTDAFVFDVGHQAYTHKLLTGRRDVFSTLRTAEGMSGFTNRGESSFDAVTAGHSGTSVSSAIGIAEAKRIAGDPSWTVAVVGDGSFTNGMIYEAINQLSGRDLRLIIILNDNEMSISKNVGGVSNYLSLIRTSEGYFNFKTFAKRFFGAIPLVGRYLVGGARRVRDFIKRILNSESLFENLGLEYIGPVNGNDTHRVSSVLEEAKKKNCPVVVHVKTKKGLGFAPSEERPDKYHSTGAFLLEPTPDSAEEKPKKRTFADEVSSIFVKLGAEDEKFCAMTAAMTDGCGLSEFAEKYPERFFDVGIAEEHLITMAGGLALGGMHPAPVLYSTFVQRCFDQMWHDVSLQGAHVMLMLSHAGLVPGDGVTHQGIYDVALASAIPNSTVYSPDDFASLAISVELAREDRGLSVVRYPKGGEAKLEIAFAEAPSRLWKSAEIGVGGSYDALVCYGRIAENALAAAKKYASIHGRAVRVIILRRVHPTPTDAELLDIIRDAENVFFVEEVWRGAGVSDRFAADVGRAVHAISIEDGFIPHGDTAYLMHHTRMDADGILSRMHLEEQ